MIQLHLDCVVDPLKEQQMLRYFESQFRPAAKGFEGFVEVHMLALRSVLMGHAPGQVNYRFSLTYQSEELRQKWISSDLHQEVWGNMEKMLQSTAYNVLLFDVAVARTSVSDTAR